MSDHATQLAPQSSRGCPYGHGCGNCPCHGECPYVDPQHAWDEIDRRLFDALLEAGRSALGMPSSVDTLRAMLKKAGLALVLVGERR